MDTKEATLFIGNIKWQYAKTYPNAPHEYSVLDWNIDNKQKFIDFAKFIAEQGQDEYYYGKKYKILILGKYKYWTMDYPLENTNLINRAHFDNKLRNKIKDYVKSEKFKFEKGMTLSDIEEKAMFKFKVDDVIEIT